MNSEDLLACQEERLTFDFNESLAKQIERNKLLSQKTRDKLLRHYISLTNNDINTRCLKRIGLLSLGLPEKEVDELCEEKKMDNEAMMGLISELNVKELNKFRREKRQKLKNIKLESGI